MEIEDVGLVEDFIFKNKHVLRPSIKEEEKWANLRLEPRIDNDVIVQLTIVQCDKLEFIGHSVTGRSLDLGLHGMRLTTTDVLPAGSIVKLTLSKSEASSKQYTLEAEVRWTTELADGFLSGIKLTEEQEFSTWQNNFGTEFVASVIGKR